MIQSATTTEFPGLTPAEIERLALLAEEMGEAIQAIGKVLRHGYASYHPDSEVVNRASLEREIADVLAAVRLMVEANDISEQLVAHMRNDKLDRVWRYLRHQPPKLRSRVLRWRESFQEKDGNP